MKLQAKNAREICDELTDEKREELKGIAEKIIELQGEITNAIKVHGIDKICGGLCKGECCAQKHEKNIFDEYYFVMALVAFSDNVRQEVMETAECLNFSPRCIYIGEDGCRIAEDSRPHLCKIWFCGSDRKMIEIGDEFNDKIYDLYQDFREVVDVAIADGSLHNISCAN